MGSCSRFPCVACCLRDTDSSGQARKEGKIKFIVLGPCLPILGASTTILEQSCQFPLAGAVSASHFQLVCLSQPSITRGATCQRHKKDLILVKMVLIDTVCTLGERGRRDKTRRLPDNFPSPLIDGPRRRFSQTCVLPSQVSF